MYDALALVIDLLIDLIQDKSQNSFDAPPLHCKKKEILELLVIFQRIILEVSIKSNQGHNFTLCVKT